MRKEYRVNPLGTVPEDWWPLLSKARSGGFDPHVSLAYGDQPYRKHPQFIEIANEPISLRLRFSGISIARAGKLVPVGKWRWFRVQRNGLAILQAVALPISCCLAACPGVIPASMGYRAAVF